MRVVQPLHVHVELADFALHVRHPANVHVVGDYSLLERKGERGESRASAIEQGSRCLERLRACDGSDSELVVCATCAYKCARKHAS